MNKMECNFSLKHFQEILNVALDSGYRFGSYDELENNINLLCVLRHDIDYTPLQAIELGKIENELDIRAYYFFQISSEIYNIRDWKVYNTIQELKEMGHHVGLHLDLSWNPEIKWENIVTQCNKEKKLFKKLTDIEPCDIISFHNPHIFTELVLNKTVEGMKHTYEKRFFSEAKYLSDSQGWYEGCMHKVFEEKRYKKIQLLIHPYIWPIEHQGGFIEDMAEMIKTKRTELTDYMVKYHPVCAKHEKKLRMLTTT